MWRPRLRPVLRHIQRPDKEPVLRVLYHPDLPFAIRSADPQRPAAQHIYLPGLHTKVAVVSLRRHNTPINLCNSRPRLKLQLHLTPRQRTRKLRYKQRRSIRVILGMLRILITQHIPCILKHHVLKPATRPQTGHVILTGLTDQPQRLFKITIRAPWRNPDRIKTREHALIQHTGRHPSPRSSYPHHLRRMCNRCIRCNMWRKARIILTDECNATTQTRHAPAYQLRVRLHPPPRKLHRLHSRPPRHLA